jgi:hypothetical protein
MACPARAQSPWRPTPHYQAAGDRRRRDADAWAGPMAGLVGDIALEKQAPTAARLRYYALQNRARRPPVSGRLRRGDQRFESPQLHQEVRANRRDFPIPQIGTTVPWLARQSSVCQVCSTVSVAHRRRVGSKVSGRKIPFPRLLCHLLPASDFEWPRGVHDLNVSRLGLEESPVAGRRSGEDGSFVTPALKPVVRGCATDPAMPSAGRRGA